MPHPAKQTRLMHGLGRTNRNIRTERPPQSEDRRPANRQPDHEKHQRHYPEPMRPAKHSPSMYFAIPHGRPDRPENYRQQQQQRSAILDLAALATGARYHL